MESVHGHQMVQSIGRRVYLEAQFIDIKAVQIAESITAGKILRRIE